MTKDKLESVRAAIEEIRSGKMIVVVDDYDRENEGDLVMAAQFATPEAINFMASHGRGLICLSMAPKLIDKLELPMMASNNQARYSTAFTVSVEAREGVTTGISAHDRAHTIQTCIKDEATRHDVVVPGHIFPLRAEEGGVLVRAGHTEAAVDLSRLAGLKEAGVICEVLNADGTMARVPDLEKFSKEHGLRLLAIADLIEYRMRHDTSLVKEIASRRQDEIEIKVFASSLSDREHLAFVKGGEQIAAGKATPFVRVHVEDVMSDWLSQFGETSGQWQATQNILARESASIVLVLRPSSLGERFRAPENFSADLRDYGVGAQILRSLGVSRMNLVSRHPGRHIVALDGFGLEIAQTVALSDYGD
ncbi:MAG TPA: 3,4-dihydroxy-2-butanone-4-phosphate synthase [Bdellovibrionota bacterium]|nr:3,4-dihydroxy-2-butanone-4-phosphate synthase [Bdellovibrionota bacterium]